MPEIIKEITETLTDSISNHYGSVWAKQCESETAFVIQKDEDLAEGNIMADVFNSQLDFTDYSEPYCLGNFGTATDFRHVNGNVYCVPDTTAEEYAEGKAVVIYGRPEEPDDAERFCN